MELDRFKRIRKNFGSHASWAYWAMPEAGESERARIADLSIFDPNENSALLSTLHTNYVLFGLNVSRGPGDTSEDFRNFHDGSPRGRDYRLRFAIKGTPLWGAYLTDFFVSLVDPRAGRVMTYAREYPGEVARQVGERNRELASVGAENAVLVALGNAAHSLLLRHFSDRQIIKIPHYSSYYKLPDYREMVASEMNRKGD